jgi:hypothetical protein
MVKRSKKSRTEKNRGASKQLTKSNRYMTEFLKKTLSIIVGASAVASILSLLLSFLPQVSVRAEGRLDPKNPFSTPFVITNSGMTGINNVTFICRLRHATNDQGGKIIAFEKGVRPMDFVVKEIRPGESATTGLPFTWIGGTTASADFDFVLEYRPSYYPLKKQSTFRFATARQQDGTLVWLPRALAE